jgi:hypothetical protein
MAPTPQDLAIVCDVVINILPSSLDVKTRMHKTQRRKLVHYVILVFFLHPSLWITLLLVGVKFCSWNYNLLHTWGACVWDDTSNTNCWRLWTQEKNTIAFIEIVIQHLFLKVTLLYLAPFFIFHGAFIKSCSHGVPKCLLKFRMFNMYYVDLV